MVLNGNLEQAGIGNMGVDVAKSSVILDTPITDTRIPESYAPVHESRDTYSVDDMIMTWSQNSNNQDNSCRGEGSSDVEHLSEQVQKTSSQLRLEVEFIIEEAEGVIQRARNFLTRL